MRADKSHTPETSDLPLAEIALNAAIELDLRSRGKVSSEWLGKLADALGREESLAIGLLPVYDRALASTPGPRPVSKADLYDKLKHITKQLSSVESRRESERLRDFCVALHDALLNQGFAAHYKSVSNAGLV
jgi:hypothetical protein